MAEENTRPEGITCATLRERSGGSTQGRRPRDGSLFELPRNRHNRSASQDAELCVAIFARTGKLWVSAKAKALEKEQRWEAFEERLRQRNGQDAIAGGENSSTNVEEAEMATGSPVTGPSGEVAQEQPPEAIGEHLRQTNGEDAIADEDNSTSIGNGSETLVGTPDSVFSDELEQEQLPSAMSEHLRDANNEEGIAGDDDSISIIDETEMQQNRPIQLFSNPPAQAQQSVATNEYLHAADDEESIEDDLYSVSVVDETEMQQHTPGPLVDGLRDANSEEAIASANKSASDSNGAEIQSTISHITPLPPMLLDSNDWESSSSSSTSDSSINSSAFGIPLQPTHPNFLRRRRSPYVDGSIGAQPLQGLGIWYAGSSPDHPPRTPLPPKESRFFPGAFARPPPKSFDGYTKGPGVQAFNTNDWTAWTKHWKTDYEAKFNAELKKRGDTAKADAMAAGAIVDGWRHKYGEMMAQDARQQQAAEEKRAAEERSAADGEEEEATEEQNAAAEEMPLEKEVAEAVKEMEWLKVADKNVDQVKKEFVEKKTAEEKAAEEKKGADEERAVEEKNASEQKKDAEQKTPAPRRTYASLFYEQSVSKKP